ncbi:hypothetical protein ABS642_07615 [Microbacterium sp. A8/3-1]|uniref:Uncharacterized protein n=1 Tax=Microbacterium sp. A8/3-1 TaxID=3160749 RepID=A0AAU7W0E2_9MICO
MSAFQEPGFRANTVRWRLAADIHDVCYHAYGVEVSAPSRVEPTPSISTPHCLIGDRSLGVIDDGIIGDPEMALEDWPEFRRRAFLRLGVPSYASTPHLGCFHRRAKARYDLCYRVCAGAAEATEGVLSFRGVETADSHLFDTWRTAITIPAGKPVRFLGITAAESMVGLLRADGLVITRSTSWTIEERLLTGQGLDDVVNELVRELRP